MGPPSVMLPIQPAEPAPAERFARLAADTGARRLLVGQSLTLESHALLAYLAGRGYGVAFGTAVALTPLRHPLDAALQARSIAALSGREYLAGYGVSEPDLVARLRGAPYPSPRATAAAYAGAVRGLLAGEAVDRTDGELVTRLRAPAVAHPRVEVGLGVLRAGMAETAGAHADVAITWLTPLPYLTGTLLPALDRGAAAAGRTRPRVVALVHAAVERPGRDPVAMLAGPAGAHLRTRHYTDMLAKAGLEADPRDPAATARTLVETGVFAHGSPAHLADVVAGYHGAGVDEVVVNPVAVYITEGLDAALEDVAAIAAACG